KGVATFLGIMLALVWPVGALCCATWLAAVAVTRISSLGALVAAALSAPYMWLLGRTEALALTLLLTVVIYWRHSTNLARLRAGTEPKVGKKT
ncbi:MAG: glycerol-3-phosphate acyltransferase, partial [Rhodobacterales bacterium]